MLVADSDSFAQRARVEWVVQPACAGRAINAGLAGGDWFLRDPDWERLRDHPRFRALVERLAR